MKNRTASIMHFEFFIREITEKELAGKNFIREEIKVAI
jgi:hypothetical protein